MVTLTYAKKHLGALIDRVAAGETIDITRRGKLVARLTAAARPRQAVDLAMFQGLTATLPATLETAADLVRSMRDLDRY
jgi:prevent-host-death family protein